MSERLKVDYNELRLAVRGMKRWQKLYKILKEELSNLGYWRLKSRGDPSKGFKQGFGKHKRSQLK